MRLDDERIERYSRQLILKEVGPRGQERLLGSRVAVVGTDVAAARVVAYLAAAGVGAITVDPVLHDTVDPGRRDCSLEPLATEPRVVDAVVVSGETPETTAAALASWRHHAQVRTWITSGHAGGASPCPCCALAGRKSPDVDTALIGLRDRVLGTVIATEIVKEILEIGTGLTGRMLAYDPGTATMEAVVVVARPVCIFDAP